MSEFYDDRKIYEEEEVQYVAVRAHLFQQGFVFKFLFLSYIRLGDVTFICVPLYKTFYYTIMTRHITDLEVKYTTMLTSPYSIPCEVIKLKEFKVICVFFVYYERHAISREKKFCVFFFA